MGGACCIYVVGGGCGQALLAAALATVVGRPEFTPEYWYLAFFSDGFKIYSIKIRYIESA